MRFRVRELIARRELLYMIAWREVKIRYKQSVMGFLWAILMPALIVSAGILVKFAFAQLSGDPLGREEIAIVSVKAVPWAFFVAAIRFSSLSLISNANLVQKIYMPREIFPAASILSQLVDLCVAAAVLTVILAVIRIGVTIQLLWVPVLLVLLILLSTGIGIFLSAAGLFFRDVKYLVEVFVTFAIFFTPVFYEVSVFGDWANLLMLNPVAPILEGLGAVVVFHRPPPEGWLIYSAAVSVIGCLGSLVLFKRMEPYFAESV